VPKYLPRCKCDPEPLTGVLRAVMDRRSGNYGKYFWSCQGAYQGRGEAGEGCGWFEWAEWDEEGEVKGWKEKRREEEKRVESDGREESREGEHGTRLHDGNNDDGIVAERGDR